MGNFGSLIQILVFILVIAGPAVGTVARKLKTHAEAKRAEAERNRRKIEAIRTGRDTVAVQNDETPPRSNNDQSRRARLEQLARQRQAQIEELRRRAALKRAQPGGQPGRQASSPQQSQPRQGRQPMNQPRSVGSHKRPTAQAHSSSIPQQSSPREAIEARRRAEIARRRAEIQASRERAARLAAADRNAKASAGKPTPKTKPARSSRRVSAEPEAVIHHDEPEAAQPIATALRDPAGLRNAIMLTEILGPPIALRQHGQGPADDPALI